MYKYTESNGEQNNLTSVYFIHVSCLTDLLHWALTNFMLCPLILDWSSWKKWSFTSYFPCRYFQTSIMSPLALRYTMLGRLAVLGGFHNPISWGLLSFVPLRCTPIISFLSFPRRGDQAATEYSKCGRTTAQKRFFSKSFSKCVYECFIIESILFALLTCFSACFENFE